MNVFDLTKRWIQIPSLSGNENPLFQEISQLLSRQGYTIKKIPSQHKRFNLFAYIQKPDILFSSHLDTVPPYLFFKEDQKFIYGRGACDAKGVIAAQICAGMDLKEKGHKNIGFLYVVGEEVDHCGAKDAVQEIPKVKAIVMGEPTENKLAIGTKGIVKVILKARGKAAHSAYPHLGVSAVHILLETLSKIQKLKFSVHPNLGSCHVNIGMIEGGAAANVLAPEALAHILIRTVSPSQEVYKKIKKCCHPKIQIQLESMNDPISLDTIPGFPETVVSFNTDLPYLRKRAKKLFLLGPGSILDAHTAHEKISKESLLRGVECYEKLALSLILSSKKIELCPF